MKDLLVNTVRPVAAIGYKTKRTVDRIPSDLVWIVAFVSVASVLLTVVDTSSLLLRAAVGFPVLFFAPGYTIVSALFPRANAVRDRDGHVFVTQFRDVTEIERIALAFGLSVSVLPLFGLTIVAVSWDLNAASIVGTITAFVLLGSLVASVRRFRIPTHERYHFGFSHKIERLRVSVFDTRSTIHTVVNVTLVITMMIALTTVGYALVAPQQGEQYTNLEILTGNESEEPVESEYPIQVESNGSIPFTVGIENQEQRETTYTMVIQEEWTNGDEVINRISHQQTNLTLTDGESVYDERTVIPEAESGTVRIVVLLYEGGTPETPTTENAYRSVYFWTEIIDDTAVASEDG